MIKILFIVGSMRKASFNRPLAEMAEKMLQAQAVILSNTDKTNLSLQADAFVKKKLSLLK